MTAAFWVNAMQVERKRGCLCKHAPDTCASLFIDPKGRHGRTTTVVQGVSQMVLNRPNVEAGCWCCPILACTVHASLLTASLLTVRGTRSEQHCGVLCILEVQHNKAACAQPPRYCSSAATDHVTALQALNARCSMHAQAVPVALRTNPLSGCEVCQTA